MDASLIEFQDTTGTLWSVWEVGQRLAHTVPGARTGEFPPYPNAGWLCFESRKERRRLSYYPYRWWKLPQQRLEQLCELAVPARVTPRSSTQVPIEPDQHA